MISTLKRYTDLARVRARARLSDRPHLALVAGAGDANLGDEAMLDVTRALLPGVGLLPVDHPATERRLRRVGLSGPTVFDGVLVGGGTLVNPHFHRLLAGVLDPALPAWTLGTGVGSSGFAMSPEVDVIQWAETLRGFDEVWVRGPLSAERLDNLGVSRIQVCGDLAMALAPPEPFALRGSGTIAVNPAASRVTVGSRDASALAGALAGALRPLVAEGWTIVPFGMHRDDAEGIAAFTAALDAPIADPVFPVDHSGLWALLEGAEAVVGVRLHAAVLAWVVGVPALLVAYRDKCRDFARQLAVEDCLIDEWADAVTIEAGVRRVLVEGRARGAVVHAAARAARTTIETAAADIRLALTNGMMG